MPDGIVVAESLVPYVEAVHQSVGSLFDLRMCLGGIGYDAVLPSTAVIEDLRFNDGQSRQGGAVRLVIARPGRVDGLLLWVDIQCAAGHRSLDTLRAVTSWLPVYVPFLIDEPLVLNESDVIDLRVAVDAGSDGVHPDYRFVAEVQTDGARMSIEAESKYAGGSFRKLHVHRALFEECAG
jgi:protein arginine N-methyltransferase 1